MPRMHLRMMGGIPHQVIPIPSFHPIFPPTAQYGMHFSRKKIRQYIGAHAKRNGLQKKFALSCKFARRIRIDFNADLKRLAARTPGTTKIE